MRTPHVRYTRNEVPVDRRRLLSNAAAFLMLGSMTGSALAASRSAALPPHSTAPRPRSQAILRSYFDALDRPGSTRLNANTLERFYAHNVTLLESLTSGRLRLHTDRRQVRAFDEWNTLSWLVVRFQRLSPTVVLTLDMPGVKGPGPELEGAKPRVILFTLKNGKIVNLVWMPA